ncbi:lipopolysaccharide biosynthesis protein [Kluyvera ascorbata]
MNNKLISYLCGSIGVFSVRFFYFVLLTIFLNANELADFTTSISISAILLSVCTYGNYNLFMRRCAQGEDSRRVLGEYVVTSIVYFMLFIAVLWGVYFFKEQVLGVNSRALIYVFFAEFFFTATPAIFKAYALSAYDKNILLDSLVNISIAVLLLISVLILFCQGRGDGVYSLWLKIYAVVGLLSFCFRLFMWRGKIIFPPMKEYVHSAISQFKDGHGFMISAVFRNIYLNVDKILILNILGGQVAGNYAIAYRFYNVFLMVLNSVSGVKEARLYHIAEVSLHELKKEVSDINLTTLKYFLLTTPLWLIISVGVYLYYPSQCAYMFISLLVLCPLQLLSFTMLNVLNSSGFEWQRLIYMLTGSVVGSVISFLLSGVFSWGAIVLGAILSSVIVLVLSRNIFNKKVNNV